MRVLSHKSTSAEGISRSGNFSEVDNPLRGLHSSRLVTVDDDARGETTLVLRWGTSTCSLFEFCLRHLTPPSRSVSACVQCNAHGPMEARRQPWRSTLSASVWTQVLLGRAFPFCISSSFCVRIEKSVVLGFVACLGIRPVILFQAVAVRIECHGPRYFSKERAVRTSREARCLQFDDSSGPSFSFNARRIRLDVQVQGPLHTLPPCVQSRLVPRASEREGCRNHGGEPSESWTDQPRTRPGPACIAPPHAQALPPCWDIKDAEQLKSNDSNRPGNGAHGRREWRPVRGYPGFHCRTSSGFGWCGLIAGGV